MLFWVEKKFEKFFSLLGGFCDNVFEKKPMVFSFASRFFEKTSRVTRFLMFDSLAYPLSIFLVGFFTNLYFDQIQIVLLKFKLFGFSQIFSILWSCPLGFQLFLLVYFLFFQIVTLNTILASSNKISSYMKSKYGESIMKELHHNSTVSTFVRSLLPAATTICIFCGNSAIEAYANVKISDNWKTVAIKCIEERKEVPPSPITTIHHTTASSVINLSGSSKG